MPKQAKVFDGEYVNGETGMDTPIHGETYERVRARLAQMKDGDALVVNARIVNYDPEDLER